MASNVPLPMSCIAGSLVSWLSNIAVLVEWRDHFNKGNDRQDKYNGYGNDLYVDPPLNGRTRKNEVALWMASVLDALTQGSTLQQAPLIALIRMFELCSRAHPTNNSTLRVNYRGLTSVGISLP